MRTLKILIVAENMSKKMGGEAGKIFKYFRKFRAKDHSVWLVCHKRVREELRNELTPDEFESIRFTDDTSAQVFFWKVSQLFPERIRELFFSLIINLMSQREAKKIVEQLIADEDIEVVFQPTPNTPFLPSLFYDLGVPVVMGPLTGGMKFPPGFNLEQPIVQNSIDFGQNIASTLHRWMPGKLQADAILVANQRTRALLPKHCRGSIHEGIIESGVDLKVWSPIQDKPKYNSNNPKVRFVYTGRLVKWKGVAYLVEAFKSALNHVDAELLIVGSGNEREALEIQVNKLGIDDRVHFYGWLSHDKMRNCLANSDVFVMPSLRESGGNSVLEAMAMGLPAIVTDWGGPGILVDETCGIKVKPNSPLEFTNGLSEAIVSLAQSKELRNRLGQNSLKRIKSNYFDWDSKVDYILGLFESLTFKQENSTSIYSVCE